MSILTLILGFCAGFWVGNPAKAVELMVAAVQKVRSLFKS